jgi:hypothetical protein
VANHVGQQAAGRGSGRVDGEVDWMRLSGMVMDTGTAGRKGGQWEPEESFTRVGWWMDGWMDVCRYVWGRPRMLGSCQRPIHVGPSPIHVGPSTRSCRTVNPFM